MYGKKLHPPVRDSGCFKFVFHFLYIFTCMFVKKSMFEIIHATINEHLLFTRHLHVPFLM